jgi:membrane protein DedA with SNARE-associated domain
MSVLSQVLASIGQFAVNAISSLGYVGVFFMMMLESMVFPLPSELVMPFAGYLISTGEFTFLMVFVFSSMGSLAGSSLSYAIGRFGGKGFLRRYGKYLLLDEDDLKSSEEYFRKKGEITILIGRMIPVVRHLISIPAGFANMKFWKFILYTFLGASIWNMFLAYLGYLFGKNWATIRHYTEYLSIVVAILLVLGFAYFAYKHVYSKRKGKKVPKPISKRK